MENLENRKPNYSNRKKKKVSVVAKKKFVLALLVATIGISSVYGITQGVSNTYDFLKDTIVHNHEIYSYKDLVSKNCHVTNDYQHYFIDTYNLAQDVRKLEVTRPEDVYHHLIGIARNMDYNRSENFRTFLNCYDLDSLAQEMSVYPTYQEFSDFLFEHNLLNEDGTINFDRWKEYDKKVYIFEKDMEKEFKNDSLEGKSL